MIGETLITSQTVGGNDNPFSTSPTPVDEDFFSKFLLSCFFY